MLELAHEGKITQCILLLVEKSRAERRTSKEKVHPQWGKQYLQKIHSRSKQVNTLDRLI